ncbi:hypothetical protein B296_00015400 [Ensete ventricosum]|uniref:Uncharacterized protein n=1 Tax=Ensete ventricosum TaxID=4639 RepID=A0A426XUL1_ENSVE|nr:hypothetical protein B296_00015400 [Ensete ventricosum]
MHIPNSGSRGHTLVLFPASDSVAQKSPDSSTNTTHSSIEHRHTKEEEKDPLVLAKKIRIRLLTINQAHYKGFACDKKGSVNSSEKGALFKLLLDNEAQMTPLSQIQGLLTSYDGGLTPARVEVASGRAGERTPILGHLVLFGQKEVLYLLVLLQGPLQTSFI